jgi:hypothetical protein
VRSNGGAGLVILASGDLGSSLVQHCTAQRNATYGVLLDSGAVRNTVADVNGGDGIYIDIGSASSNVATRNSIGLSLGVGAAGFGNTMRDNSAGNFFARTNGANLGQNFCSGRGGGC